MCHFEGAREKFAAAALTLQFLGERKADEQEARDDVRRAPTHG